MKPELTEREFAVTQLVCQGFKSSEIAEKLSVTEATIKYHLTKIYKKFGVKTRTQLAIKLAKPTEDQSALHTA